MEYTRIKCKDHEAYAPISSAISCNVGAAYTLMYDKWVGVGFIAGFNMINHTFRPENVCLDNWGQIDYSEKEKEGSLKNLFFGFSVYFDLDYKRETSDNYTGE